ncbi:ComEC/Rec2 family competence protein [Sphingomonas immobilis]|uniref:ComEC/Rec2 family competence protein n=1 Tax=Sphingomonas immobilis TaxID=3063997 RepID=A0ABT8ZUA4_9SPHN|nr:ComEC/Rec2 family competence protein [Sphingomonas sp. CA1-15]MDO7841150.1 ComEC/Rec2 family competence protein [Sphingomonas sp. CA1-15]
MERWLEAERDQLVLWLPVALGAGIAAWFLLPDAPAWITVMLVAAGAALGGVAIGRGDRAGRAIAVGGVLVAVGVAIVWWRAESVWAPPLAAPAVVTFEARVERIEPLVARDLVRLRLAPLRVLPGSRPSDRPPPTLPSHIRVNIAEADVPAGLTRGAVISLGARLMPPPGPAVPGAYDYARVAWFDGIGATGRGFAPVKIVTAGGGDALSGLRQTLSKHIQTSAPGGAGAIAAALATGDQGAISQADADAMRRSGLAHLLSVSGLHITAAVGAVMLLVGRLLALSPWIALRTRIPLIAAGAGALAAIGYTLLTGAEVPTIRSCVAALLVLVALAMGREALTLRLVAAGAFVVLLLFPEALAGPSFQLSFAAVAAIISLHEHPAMRRWFGPHEEGRGRAMLRGLASLLLTGLVVEVALIPISVYHFHRAGVYGAVANIVAIPLTTFVTMPLEALALLLDPVGLGWPFWWLTARSLDLLLWIAHAVAGLPGAVAALPAVPGGAYALMVAGGLWIALWRTRWRRLGAVPLAAGAIWALATPAPDLLVTGDGRHVAIRTSGGNLAVLRDRVGDYTADIFSENAGIDAVPVLLSEQPDARCSRDLCLATRTTGGRSWRILATRSAYLVPAKELIAACASADIVVSERGLPRGCMPRWLKLDRATLATTGGVAIALAAGRTTTVRQPGDKHPWVVAPPVVPERSRRRWRQRSGRSAGAARERAGVGQSDSSLDRLTPESKL